MTDAEEKLTGVWGDVVEARKLLMDAMTKIAGSLSKLEMLEAINAAPRVLELEELDCGVGWYEQIIPGDDEDPGEVLLVKCVFLGGWVLIGDGDGTFDKPETLKRWYGKDRRIWSAKPTDEERSGEKWVV